ncbi:MAG: hypothetical protein CVV18_02310, partial [Gammaproteobacteria bacterium HGW-Gammaproteobacteria-8]
MKNFAWILIAFVTGLTAVLLLLPEPAVEENQSASTGDRVFFTGALVFDGDDFIDNATLVIAEGRVVALGRDLVVDDGAEVVDAAGKTILPGLIDAHVHSFGTARADALRFGVTTILDMFRPPMDFKQIHAQRESLAPTDRADLYSAGFLATAPGGHGTQYGIEVPTLTAPNQAADWVAARKAEGSDWIKIVIEPGWGARDLPTLDAATVAALIEATHANDLRAVAHVATWADAMMAIEAGIDGLVHLFSDRPADQAFIASARQAGIFVVPTTPVLAAMHHLDGTDGLIEHPVLGPRLERSQIQGLRQRFPVQPDPAGWNNVKASIRALHAAEVPILAGSDAPNPGTTYGASIHHALRLLVEAGMSPHDALHAATAAPARAFGIGDRGCLKPGCRADLLIVQGNPSTDIEATANIEAVWKNGIPVEFGTAIATVADDRVQSVAESPIDLLAAPDRWRAAADDYMGGSSNAALNWDETGAAR